LSGEDYVAAKDYNDWIACDDGPVTISFDIIPKEARDYIREKALTIAGVEQAEVIQAVKDKLEEAIKNGTSLDNFKSQINSIFDSFGITKLSSRHLDTIFRTNLYSAYAIGKLAQVDDMRDRFPLWQYSAIHDSRTRLSHLELDGRIFRVGEGPIPPIDYNCRCTAIYLHISQTTGLDAEDWQGGSTVMKFNTRQSFEDWRASKASVITGAVQQWINDSL
jgi:SPP1 gp7 family putative phage head morphogenesis protein